MIEAKATTDDTDLTIFLRRTFLRVGGSWVGGDFGGGGLERLEVDFGSGDGEECVGARAFRRLRRAATISSTVSWRTMPPQCRQVTVPQRA